MNEIVIKIKGDSSDIVKLGEQLKNLGKIDEENAKQFKKTNDDFKKGAKESKSALNEVLSEITDIRGQLVNLGKGIAAAFAIEAIISFGRESVAAFMEAELNARKLQAAVKNIANENEAAAQALLDQSDIWQSQSIYSDDAIQAAQTQLLQFGLTTKQVETLIPRIIDLASAQGENGLAGTTDLVIAGLNGQMRGLKSIGSEFNATGDIAQDFNSIMQSTEKFVGSAATTMETAAGKAQYYRNRLDEIKESIGAGLVEAIDFSAESFGKWGKIIDGLADPIRSFFGMEQSWMTEYIERAKLKVQADKAQEEASNSNAKSSIRNVFFLNNAIAAQDEIIKGQNSTIAQVNKALKDKAALEKELNALLGRNTEKQKENTDAKKEELTTLEKLYKIYEDLDKAVQRNTQNGIVDLELIKKRDLAEREYIGFNMKQVGQYIDLVYKKDYANQVFTDEQFARGEEEIANDDKVLAEKKKNAKEEIDVNKEKNDKIKEQNEKAARDAEELDRAENDLAVTLMRESINVFSAIQRNAYEEDVRALDKKLQNQQISQEEYDKQIRKMKRDQAIQDKIYASYNIVLNTAQAVVRAFAESAVAGPVLATTAAIIGAAQLAIAVAAPLPEYAKGTSFLKRGKNKPGIDTIPVMANEGEAIIPTEKNAQHPGLAEAWIKGNLEQYVHNKFVIPALKANNKGRDDAAFISKLAKSISLNAAFNDGNLLESDKMSRRILMEQNSLLKKIASGSNKNPYRF